MFFWCSSTLNKFGKNAPAKLIHENINERAVLINVGGWLYVTVGIWYTMGKVRRIRSEKDQKMSLYLPCSFPVICFFFFFSCPTSQRWAELVITNSMSFLHLMQIDTPYYFIFWQTFANVSNLILRQFTLTGSSIGHKLHPLLVNKWDLYQTK